MGSKVADIFGPTEAGSEEKEAEFVKYRALLTEKNIESADAPRRRAVFQRTCQAYHKMHGEGGLIGPDLTGSNRTDLNYVLGNVLSPSDVIQDAYKMSLVLTGDGRLYSGILASESDQKVELRVVGEEEVVAVPKSTILSQEVASISMMPEGLLRDLTDTEVINLIAYLRALEQVPLPQSTEK
jgi:putative heme-binding domain-containing protein